MKRKIAQTKQKEWDDRAEKDVFLLASWAMFDFTKRPLTAEEDEALGDAIRRASAYTHLLLLHVQGRLDELEKLSLIREGLIDKNPNYRPFNRKSWMKRNLRTT